MNGCYILFSEKLNKFYVGATQESIELRIEKHNLKKFFILSNQLSQYQPKFNKSNQFQI